MDYQRWHAQGFGSLMGKDFGRAMAGEGVAYTEAPTEGKVNFNADLDGLLVVDEKRLEMFNLVPGVMCASRHGFTMVNNGASLAGSRAIPLFLPRADFDKAMALLSDGPLLSVLPLRKARVGILVTGTEVFQGLIKDRFIPIIRDKVERIGSQVVNSGCRLHCYFVEGVSEFLIIKFPRQHL